MRIVVATAVIVIAAALPAGAAAESTSALHLCGTLREHRPATGSATGQLRIGTRTYTVATAVTAGNGGVEVAIGRDLCIEGSVGDHSGQLVRYTFFWVAPDRRSCGTVSSVVPQDITMRSDFGQLRLYRDAAVPSPQQYERVCYETVVRTDTGDLAATRKLPLEGPGALERKTHCGTVSAYRPATDSADGLIKVGSRQFTIAKATRYTGDPAGDRTDRTAPGQQMCLVAALAPTRDIANPTITAEYLTRPMETRIGGTASEYRVPSAAAPGIAILSYGSQFELRIPAAIDAAIDITRGSYCFTTTVDAAGDISVSAVVTCPQGSAAGPGVNQTAAPGATSASPGPAATATPTATATRAPMPTAVAAASPAPEGSAMTTVRVSPDPLLVLGLMGITALGLLAIYLARRRAG